MYDKIKTLLQINEDLTDYQKLLFNICIKNLVHSCNNAFVTYHEYFDNFEVKNGYLYFNKNLSVNLQKGDFITLYYQDYYHYVQCDEITSNTIKLPDFCNLLNYKGSCHLGYMNIPDIFILDFVDFISKKDSEQNIKSEKLGNYSITFEKVLNDFLSYTENNILNYRLPFFKRWWSRWV
jgi:hypothetical protein